VRIGVVSDTHMYGRAKGLPSALLKGLQGVDMILHAGDWMEESVIDQFAAIAPVEGVAGNNDGESIVARLGYRKLLPLAGYLVGIVHGDGGRSTPDTAYQSFSNDQVDVIVFGHSHVPYTEQRGSVLLFNPGSPTDKRRQPQYSYGILTLEEQGIRAEHHYYDDKSAASHT
jgi:uncharacterized protein